MNFRITAHLIAFLSASVHGHSTNPADESVAPVRVQLSTMGLRRAQSNNTADGDSKSSQFKIFWQGDETTKKYCAQCDEMIENEIVKVEYCDESKKGQQFVMKDAKFICLAEDPFLCMTYSRVKHGTKLKLKRLSPRRMPKQKFEFSGTPGDSSAHPEGNATLCLTQEYTEPTVGEVLKMRTCATKTIASNVGRSAGSAPTKRQFKMFWEEGMMWQEKTKPKAYCSECEFDCQEGDRVLVNQCDDANPKQMFTMENGMICSGMNNLVCFTYEEIRKSSKITLQRRGLPRQTFDFTGKDGIYQLHPRGAHAYCMTQHHQPRGGEELKLEGCRRAEHNDPGINDDTSRWVMGCFDGHETKNQWLDSTAGNEGGCVSYGSLGYGSLVRGQYICSPDESIKFGLDESGSVTLVRNGVSTAIARGTGHYLQIQSDGNLALYSNCGDHIWSSRTAGEGRKGFYFLSVTTRGDEPVHFTRGREIIWTPSGNYLGMRSPPLPDSAVCRGATLDTNNNKLKAGRYICSGEWRFGMNEYGDVVQERKDPEGFWRNLWEARSQRKAGGYLKMTSECNLEAMREGRSRHVWSSETTTDEFNECRVHISGEEVSIYGYWENGDRKLVRRLGVAVDF